MIDLSKIPAMPVERGTVTIFTGQKMAYPEDDDVLKFLRQGWFEFKELAFFLQLLRAGDHFVDAGAHCGLYSVLAEFVLGVDGHIHIVEPNNALYPYLKSNIELTGIAATDHDVAIPGAFLWPYGISSEYGMAKLQYYGDANTAYGTLAQESDQSGGISFDIETIELTCCLSKNVDKFQFVKMDVEGLEYVILSSVLAKISDLNIHFLIEFDETRASYGGNNTEELAKLLKKNGFGLFVFDQYSGELIPFSSPFPIWNLNLVASKNIEILNQRLGGCSPEILALAKEQLSKGFAAYTLYEQAEKYRGEVEFQNVLSETLQNLYEKLDPSAEMIYGGEETDINIVNDLLGRVTGASLSIASELDKERKDRKQLSYSLFSTYLLFASSMADAIKPSADQIEHPIQIAKLLHEESEANIAKLFEAKEVFHTKLREEKELNNFLQNICKGAVDKVLDALYAEEDLTNIEIETTLNDVKGALNQIRQTALSSNPKNLDCANTSVQSGMITRKMPHETEVRLKDLEDSLLTLQSVLDEVMGSQWFIIGKKLNSAAAARLISSRRILSNAIKKD